MNWFKGHEDFKPLEMMETFDIPPTKEDIAAWDRLANFMQRELMIIDKSKMGWETENPFIVLNRKQGCYLAMTDEISPGSIRSYIANCYRWWPHLKEKK